MPTSDLDSEWQRKGATLSDKTARKEYGLTQDEIVRAIKAEDLQYRRNSIHGNRNGNHSNATRCCTNAPPSAKSEVHANTRVRLQYRFQPATDLPMSAQKPTSPRS